MAAVDPDHSMPGLRPKSEPGFHLALDGAGLDEYVGMLLSRKRSQREQMLLKESAAAVI